MSHFTKINTKIIDVECLVKALESLGIEHIERGEDIVLNGFSGQSRLAQIAIRRRNLPGNLGRYTDMGFAIQEDGTYALVCDDYFPKEVKAFTDNLMQHYAYNVVVSNAQAQGWSIVEEASEQDGSIRLVCQQW